MWTQVYLGWLALYVMVGIAGVVALLRTPRTSGDAAMGQALGIFYVAGLLGVTVIGWFLRSLPALGSLVLASPLVFLAWPRIQRGWTDAYARLPSRKVPPALTITVRNETSARLLLKLDCWFGASRGSLRLYRTLTYRLAPKETRILTPDGSETRLLAAKAQRIGIQWFELVQYTSGNEQILREIQPCMHHFDEKPEAFQSGAYELRIHAAANSKTFAQTVQSQKESGLYGDGVF